MLPGSNTAAFSAANACDDIVTANAVVNNVPSPPRPPPDPPRRPAFAAVCLARAGAGPPPVTFPKSAVRFAEIRIWRWSLIVKDVGRPCVARGPPLLHFLPDFLGSFLCLHEHDHALPAPPGPPLHLI